MAPLLLREPVCGIRSQSSKFWAAGGWAGGSLHLSSWSLRMSSVSLEVRLGDEACFRFVPLCFSSPGPAVGQYTSPVARRCCQDGLTRLPMRRSCEQRVARVQQPACREPFLSCCQFAEALRKKAHSRGQVGLARGEGPRLGGAGGQARAPGRAERPPPHSPPPWSPALELLQEDDLMDEDDILVRSFFPENWLWRLAPVDRFLQ